MALSGLRQASEHLAQVPLELNLDGSSCQVLASTSASPSSIIVSCGCPACAARPGDVLYRDGGRLLSLDAWALHVTGTGAGPLVAGGHLERLTVMQPGTEYKAPLLAWLRAATHHMGGEVLVRKQLSIFWWNIDSDGPAPSLPPPPSQRQASGPKSPSGAWRAATVVGFDPFTSVLTLKYHSDPKKHFSQVLLPLCAVHFARMPPPPGTAPRNIFEGRSPLPSVLVPPPSAPAAYPRLPLPHQLLPPQQQQQCQNQQLEGQAQQPSPRPPTPFDGMCMSGTEDSSPVSAPLPRSGPLLPPALQQELLRLCRASLDGRAAPSPELLRMASGMPACSSMSCTPALPTADTAAVMAAAAAAAAGAATAIAAAAAAAVPPWLPLQPQHLQQQSHAAAPFLANAPDMWRAGSAPEPLAGLLPGHSATAGCLSTPGLPQPQYPGTHKSVEALVWSTCEALQQATNCAMSGAFGYGVGQGAGGFGWTNAQLAAAAAACAGQPSAGAGGSGAHAAFPVYGGGGRGDGLPCFAWSAPTLMSDAVKSETMEGISGCSHAMSSSDLDPLEPQQQQELLLQRGQLHEQQQGGQKEQQVKEQEAQQQGQEQERCYGQEASWSNSGVALSRPESRQGRDKQRFLHHQQQQQQQQRSPKMAAAAAAPLPPGLLLPRVTAMPQHASPCIAAAQQRQGGQQQLQQQLQQHMQQQQMQQQQQQMQQQHSFDWQQQQQLKRTDRTWSCPVQANAALRFASSDGSSAPLMRASHTAAGPDPVAGAAATAQAHAAACRVPGVPGRRALGPLHAFMEAAVDPVDGADGVAATAGVDGAGGSSAQWPQPRLLEELHEGETSAWTLAAGPRANATPPCEEGGGCNGGAGGGVGGRAGVAMSEGAPVDGGGAGYGPAEEQLLDMFLVDAREGSPGADEVLLRGWRPQRGGGGGGVTDLEEGEEEMGEAEDDEGEDLGEDEVSDRERPASFFSLLSNHLPPAATAACGQPQPHPPPQPHLQSPQPHPERLLQPQPQPHLQPPSFGALGLEYNLQRPQPPERHVYTTQRSLTAWASAGSGLGGGCGGGGSGSASFVRHSIIDNMMASPWVAAAASDAGGVNGGRGSSDTAPLSPAPLPLSLLMPLVRKRSWGNAVGSGLSLQLPGLQFEPNGIAASSSLRLNSMTGVSGSTAAAGDGAQVASAGGMRVGGSSDGHSSGGLSLTRLVHPSGNPSGTRWSNDVPASAAAAPTSATAAAAGAAVAAAAAAETAAGATGGSAGMAATSNNNSNNMNNNHAPKLAIDGWYWGPAGAGAGRGGLWQ